jgi:[acyl-carrier-protein] S-malonyltransferase
MGSLALLYPGQGSQYVGMGQALCADFPVARVTFEEASDVLGFDLRKLCFEGDPAQLTLTENAQPALLTAAIAALRVYLREIGVIPEFTAGHSLGEITALTGAGAIDFADALRIVRQRGRFMQEASALGMGSMMAFQGVELSLVDAECAKVNRDDFTVVVSNYNAPDQTVISGLTEAVLKVTERLAGHGAEAIPLNVSAPFHSPLMNAAAAQFAFELQKYRFHPLRWPVISNVDALPYAGPERIPENLIRQITGPVRWAATMEFLAQQGITEVIEIGPKNVLKNLARRNLPAIPAYSYDNQDDRKILLRIHSQATSSPTEFKHTVVTKCIQIAVCTRNRNWNNDQYQKGVVEPYRRVQGIQDELEREGREPTLEEMKEALEMLQSVFATKQTPLSEQVERFNEIFMVTGTLFPDFKMPGIEATREDAG